MVLVILIILSYVLLLMVFGSLIKDSYWIFKALEFPRVQKLVLIAVLIAGWVIYWQVTGRIDPFAFGALIVSAAYLIYKIFPYTPIFPKEV
ncbi:MAG TPA: hypothetical protein VGE66_11790, partial [Chitinophagaceae bacterium]